MNFALPAHVNLDGADYTDESRQPVQVAWDERATTVELASGKIKKYVKYKARKFTITWDNMPEAASESVDGNAGRNELATLVQGQDIITLILDDGHNSPATYDCLITDYSEEIVYRRESFIRWNCTLSLQEIGG